MTTKGESREETLNHFAGREAMQNHQYEAWPGELTKSFLHLLTLKNCDMVKHSTSVGLTVG